jgi:hypothetical protein
MPYLIVTIVVDLVRKAIDMTEFVNGCTIVRNQPDAASTVGRWIAETTQQRRRLETLLNGQPTTRLTKEDIKALVASLRDITATLAQADPADKAAAYTEMGIEVTYHQDGRVLIESRPRVLTSVSEGGLEP